MLRSEQYEQLFALITEQANLIGQFTSVMTYPINSPQRTNMIARIRAIILEINIFWDEVYAETVNVNLNVQKQ
jgi:hypothetical protein